MEFLRLGDMTLFICFVQSSLLLPTTSPFWNQCVHGSRLGNRMFLWHSHSELWASARTTGSYRRAEQGGLWLHCPSRWSSSESTNQPELPSVWNPAHPRYLDGSDQLPSSSQWQDWKREVALPLRRCRGTACPDRLPHTRNSQAHHYHILWALNSASQSFCTLHRVFVTVPCKFSQLAKISATCRSLPHCYQLLRGRTVGARGQSRRWLDRLAAEQTGAVWTGYWKMALRTQECTERQLLV